MNEYKTTVGIEVHAELKTKSKIFSNSANNYGKMANTCTNVIDLGYPGVLPTVNEKAIELALRAALVLNCKINKKMHFDRKNYFYPDNPKNYQITQNRTPIGINGYVEINVKDGKKKIRIHDIHIEEDTCKSIHNKNKSMLDFNRAGIPLVEIVTEADINSSEEAMKYLEKLRELLLYADVSDCKIEEGSMRCDCNVSVSKTEKLGTKIEIKNIGSITNVGVAIDYETKRQIALLENKKELKEETRRFDDKTNTTVLMRIKETGNDYRYFPEPDLMPLEISREWIEEIKSKMPELPNEKMERYQKAGLSEYDASVIVNQMELALYFDKLLEKNVDAKTASNFLTGEIAAYLKEEKISIEDSKLTVDNFAQLLDLLKKGTISNNIAKSLVVEILKTGEDAKTLVDKKGLSVISDESSILPIVQKIIKDNPEQVAAYKGGKDKLFGFFVGQAMKETKGRANPQLLNKLLKQELEK